MFQFNYKLKLAERVKVKCERHPRYNPERDGRGGSAVSSALYGRLLRRQQANILHPNAMSAKEHKLHVSH
jgi:hypothetical protein